MPDKVVYMRPGETLEIRHLTHEDFERNAKSWQDQPRPRSDLLKVNGPHSFTPATTMSEFHHWKTWDSPTPAPQPHVRGIEPTEEMLIAGEEAYHSAPQDEDGCTQMAAAFKAMLRAAKPSPQPHGLKHPEYAHGISDAELIREAIAFCDEELDAYEGMEYDDDCEVCCQRSNTFIRELAARLERSATPAPRSLVEMDDEDRTPAPEGYDAAQWRKADEVHHAMALVADDTECVKIIYAALTLAPQPQEMAVDRFAPISDQQIRDIMECGDTSTARIKICRLIYERTKPAPQPGKRAPLNRVIATGRTRRRWLFWTQYEYEGPVYTARWQTPYNVSEWPREKYWRYEKPAGFASSPTHDNDLQILFREDTPEGGVVRFARWPEGYVLWHHGRIVWRSWKSEPESVTLKIAADTSDVINLVIAAREALSYTYGLDGEELQALDRAVEAFADRVPFEDSPDDEKGSADA